MSCCPPVSIIINTDGRAAILGNTIESLRYLRYPRLELVVVPGPTADGTRELLKSWQGEVKVGSCPVRNLARSRNIGIEIASGEVVAFVDDDEIPEPEWLEDLVPLLQEPKVAVAGGWLHDHTGKGYEARFETVDRLGNRSWERAAPEFNFPLSYSVPHLTINNAFRKSALVDVGGFDEEFEYLFDETDLMVRLVDRGWHIVQTDRGFVHHKYLPSSVRNEQRVLTSWYSAVKNKTYFALIHGRRFLTIDRILADIVEFVEGNRREVRKWIEQGALPSDMEQKFDSDVERAVRDGIARALSGRQRLGDPARLAGDPAGFVRFHTYLPPARQHCFVFLGGTYPPAVVDGIDPPVHRLARAVAARGHQVHVLTRGESHDQVDFENGVWVHRLVVRDLPEPAPGDSIPAEIWRCSATMLAEVEEIARRRPIRAVHAPLANAAAIAFLQAHKWPLITSLHGAPCGAEDDAPQWRAKAIPPPAIARELLIHSDGLVAPGETAVAAVEAVYGLTLDRGRLAIVSDDAAVQEIEFLLRFAAQRAFSPTTERAEAAT